MFDLLLRLIFALGFVIFGVRLIIDLMGVELHFTRWERAALSLIFATICIGFALSYNPDWDRTIWRVVIRILLALVILIMSNKVARAMIKLHYPRP